MSHLALIGRHKTPESPQSTLPHSCMNKYFVPHRGATRKATLAATLHSRNFQTFQLVSPQMALGFCVSALTPLLSR